MTITDVLDRVYDDTISSECRVPLREYSREEVLTLADKQQLRMLRFRLLNTGVPMEKSLNCIDCVAKLRDLGKNYFLLLQYCLVFNQYLFGPFTETFPEMR